MNLRESSGIALAALRANKMRSFLTLLGTIIGVMSVIAVLSFVEGLNRFVSEKLLNAGANVFYVDPYGLVTSQEAWEKVKDNPVITLDDADALHGSVPHASIIIAQSGTNGSAHYRGKEVKNVSIKGSGPGYEIIDDLTIAEGRQLTELDDQRRRMVCVIGSDVVDELFPNADPVGKEIRLGSESYEVVGVIASKGKLFGQSQDRFATIPIRTFQKFKQKRGNFGIAVKTIDQASMPVAEQEVRNRLRGLRHLRPGQPDNFGITTSENVMELYQNLTGGIFVVTVGVAAISLLVGGIVIMNIMLVSVTERTREIGIRKAMGAKRRDILTQFLVEATTLSMTGGLIGVLSGIGIAMLVGAVSPLPAAVSWPAVAMGITMSGLIGIFFGSFPAWRASRLDPIDALRYE
ncbi:MAG: ABC transporter permease [Candidatus Eisenbacteria bacterium]|uniref:ABC transporter permease n=1 Tax=Eiseniibacteriota bacterium TaxID=2212470 RepID=A0A9D6QIR4_UNCEI|nr:ABC transporter permease [Candidatus Eisenbacteria bacterium]MBI3539707.1 ABC transporter permease [Candidatus Eisenbacteria bacterium]